MFGGLNKVRGRYSRDNASRFYRCRNSKKKTFLVTAFDANASVAVRVKSFSVYLGYIPFFTIHKIVDGIRKR